VGEFLECVEIEPGEPARAAVIWLHGLGADGRDFAPIVPELGLAGQGVRFVFPHAPRRPVTINMGMTMRAWYDIAQLDLRRGHDEAGIRESARQVGALIEREIGRGVAPGKIVLAGFSQGGAIALHVGVRYPKRLGGLLALSTYLVCDETLEAERGDANRELPILQAHGAMDPMVHPDRGESARDRLRGLGYDVEWKSYPIGHEVCPDEIRDVAAWLRDRLAVPTRDAP